MTGPLLPEHLELLAAGAIPAEVATSAGAYSVSRADGLPDGIRFDGPGIVFQHHPLVGVTVPQYRPDHPTADGEGRVAKYVFPAGTGSPLNVVPAMRARVATASRILVVEGTKQTLAAVAHAPEDVLVAGIAGCWGFSRNDAPNPELGMLQVDGRAVVVAFDSDIARNPKVHEAGARLAEHLELLGATSVRFLSLPAGGSVGLDDFLATVPDPGAVLARLLDKASKLGRRPKAAASDVGARFFDQTGLRAVDLVDAVRASGEFAASPDGSVFGYRDGVYLDCDPVVGAVVELLGNRFRDQHLRTATTILVDQLRSEGAVLGDSDPVGLVNVRNGMLRISTGRLEPHDPAHLSRYQLAVDWNPTATCPRFDAWLAGRCGAQAEDLLEAAGLMLCPWIGQRRTVFLFGPARSGKSTFLRMLEALVGRHRCAVTLHQLGTNRFAAANLFGKLLNVAGDLSDHHVDDLSMFKLVTGDDAVSGERKNRDAFVFHNKALFVFSANTPPTVSETSRAYLARIRPFLFPASIEGAEDPDLEASLLAETEGIFRRLVEGAQRWTARSGYGPGDPLVADEFAQQSDVAAMFASQVVAADPGGFTSGKVMFDTYREWADANGRGRLGRNKFLARLENTLGQRQRAEGLATGPTGWRDVQVLAADEWVDADPLARFARFLTTPPHEGETEVPEGAITPREAGVGPDRANRATPEPAQVGADRVVVDF